MPMRSRTLPPNAKNPWISKTQLRLYLRCPYAFFQIDSGALAPAVMIDELGEQLIEQGVTFEQSVISEIAPLRSEISLEQALIGDAPVYCLPLIRNDRLKLLGIPDGIDPADGALVPIEIKSHKDVQQSDLLELAFYWLLLKPYRARHDTEPRGRLILRRDGIPETLDVEIERKHLARVRKLLGDMRRARYYGVRPRVCNCPVCAGVLREQITTSTRASKDLTMIWGINRAYAEALEDMGVLDYPALIGCDSQAIVESFRERGYFVSAGIVDSWRHHASAYVQAAPVVFGNGPDVGGRFIAVDLEYDALVWLIGVLIDDGSRRERIFLWADNSREEKQNLCALAEIVRAQPGLPVITWSGDSADLPQLQKAAARHSLGDFLDPVFDRHVDLYACARESFRLPAPNLKLEAVASYFGVPKTSSVRNGLEAQMMYQAYLGSRDPKRRAEIRRELLDYNQDDLDMLVGVLEAIQRLPGNADGTAARIAGQFVRQDRGS
jgi:predicted RecB family nuclease